MITFRINYLTLLVSISSWLRQYRDSSIVSKHNYLQDQSSATKIDDSNLKDDRFLSKCKALLFLLRDLARFKGAERCTCASTNV